MTGMQAAEGAPTVDLTLLVLILTVSALSMALLLSGPSRQWFKRR